MFVVITLVAGGRAGSSRDGIATFSTPTVVLFCAGLLVSALLCAPWHAFEHAAIVLGTAGVYGVAYSLRVVHRTRRQDAYEPEFEDWLWYAALPLTAYAAVAAAAIALVFKPASALFVFAGAVLLLILIGIHNAWDVVTYLAVEKIQPPSGSTLSANGAAEGTPGGTHTAAGES